jgi:homoaconitate hydratase
MGQNRIEKIAERHAVRLPESFRVHAGDFVSIRPAHVMTHDNTGAVIPKFLSVGARHVFDPKQPVFCLDHDVQNESPTHLAKYAAIEAFARAHGIAFFPAKAGIGHQVMVEEGFALPGGFVVASDSHSNLYGAIGALGTPIVRTDVAAIWATGETWWQVPEVVRVSLTGRLTPGATGKDVILCLIGLFNQDEVLNCCIEFAGEVGSLSMDQRLTISNMSTEWGALAGVFPFDAVAKAWLHHRAASMIRRGDQAPRLTTEIIEKAERENPMSDPDAFYAKEFTFDLGSVTPHIAGPTEVKIITPVPEVEAKRVPIQKAYILSCVNGRLEDIAEAARVLRGRKVAAGVKLYLAAASTTVQDEAQRLGHWQVLIGAGAIVLPPGCGPCIGLGEGLMEPGETGISATNRNFQGRMGARDSFVYLASPAVVAASAAAGYIAAPIPTVARPLQGTVEECEAPQAPRERISIREGFPKVVEGPLLLLRKDNLSTDSIYGKDYTYRDDMPPPEMAKVAMVNYDPQFQAIARGGDIVIGGWNFGCGSSREQAATALKYRGLSLIVAGSYSQTYKRNAFNNGLIVIECPKLIKELRSRFDGRPELTIRTDMTARVDFETSEIAVEGEIYPFAPLREVVQELVALGGFESVLVKRLS